MVQIVGSSRRLVLDIATFGILAAFIWISPESSLKFALVVGQYAPSLAICAFFTYACKNRTRALLFASGGAALGWLLAPTVWVNYEFQNWYDDYAYYYRFWPVYSGIGAFVAGLTIYVVECVASRSTSYGYRDESSSAAKKPR